MRTKDQVIELLDEAVDELKAAGIKEESDWHSLAMIARTMVLILDVMLDIRDEFMTH